MVEAIPKDPPRCDQVLSKRRAEPPKAFPPHVHDQATLRPGIRRNPLHGFRPTLLYADHQLIHMLPAPDFHEQKRFRQGTQASQVIDHLAENFHKP